jgi:hypothetical protein
MTCVRCDALSLQQNPGALLGKQGMLLLSGQPFMMRAISFGSGFAQHCCDSIRFLMVIAKFNHLASKIHWIDLFVR